MPSKLEARVAQHDREIAAIRKLILVGMKMTNRNSELARRNEEMIRALAESQRKTDRLLREFIDS